MGRHKEGRSGEGVYRYRSKIWIDTVDDLAKQTGLSKSAVEQELMGIGLKQFRVKHRLDYDVEKTEEAENVEVTEEDKGEKLAEAYMRKKLFDYDDAKKEWQES